MQLNNYIPPKERLGLLLLVLLIVLAHTLSDAYNQIYGFSKEEKTDLLGKILEDEKTSTPTSNIHPIPLLEDLPPIDPNDVEIEKLSEYGISDYAANNLKKYRKAGGTIDNMSDLLKIYGMDSSQLKASEHHFKFSEEEENRSPTMDNKKVTTHNIPPVVSNASREYTKFDPNNANYEILISSGFSKFAATNLVKYRNSGGIINRDSDLLKIYGIDTSLLSLLIPNIRFSEPVAIEDVSLNYANDTIQNKPVKATNNISTIDLSSTTQEQLMELVGIGPVISKRIIEYRQKLGGFYEKEQLLEIYSMTPERYENIESHLVITGDIVKFYAPNLSFKAVLQHPYCDYETTKLLKNISILNYDEELQKLIDEDAIDQRLIPYLHLSNPILIQSN